MKKATFRIRTMHEKELDVISPKLNTQHSYEHMQDLTHTTSRQL